jgi:hypothetical protein
MPPKGYEPNYRLITEEELRQIIKDADAELKAREEERYEELKNDVVRALQALKSAFPHSEILVYDLCRRCGEEVEVDVLELLDTIIFNQ